MLVSGLLKSGAIAAGLLIVLSTAGVAENAKGGRQSGGSSTSASVGGGSSASASVGSSSGDCPSPSSPPSRPTYGGSTCNLSLFNSAQYVWKVSSRHDCGCGYRKVKSSQKWMCPVKIRTAKAR